MATNLLSKFNLDGTSIDIVDTTARTNAQTAISTANTASSTATTAKSTADTAKSTADTANTAVNNLKTTVDKIVAESRVTVEYNSTNETMTITTTTHATN